MAYYDSMNKKPMSRQQHLQKDAKEWNRDWKDEGSRYRKGPKPEGNRGASFNKGSRPFNGAGEHSYENTRSFNDRGPRSFENRGPRGNGFFNDRGPKAAPSFRNEDRPSRPAFKSAPERPARTNFASKKPFAAPEAEFNREPENLISGRNPIREAIKAGRDIEKILVAKGDLSATAREIVAMARESHIPVQTVERTRLDEITRNHQGMLAYASAYRYYEVEDMLEDARSKNEKPFLIVLDSVTDPQNLGAIIRTAACVGAHGVIVPQRRAVGLTPSAVKASAGAIERIKVARVGNLSRTLDMLKKEGIWLYAADMAGEDFRKVDFAGAVALVIGSEGDGISRLTLEKCDYKVKLPMTGAVDSLNASVAAGVLMYAAYSAR